MTIEEVCAEINRLIEEAGSCVALSRRWGLNQGYVSDIANGRQRPGPEALRRLGLKVEIRYVPDTESRESRSPVPRGTYS